MECINKVSLLGYVGSDPILKTFQNGNPVASFSLATSFSWKDKSTGEKKSNTEWHKVVCFSSVLCALIQEYIKKGSRLYVEGSLRTREWETADKSKRTVTEIVLNDFYSRLIFLDKKDEFPEVINEHKNNINKKIISFDEIDDDIPF